MACVKAIIQQLESEHLMLNALPPVQIMCVILGVCMCRCFYHRLVIQSTFDLDGVQGIYKNYTSSGPVRPVVAALILLLDRVVPVAWPAGRNTWGPRGVLRAPFRVGRTANFPYKGRREAEPLTGVRRGETLLRGVGRDDAASQGSDKIDAAH